MTMSIHALPTLLVALIGAGIYLGSKTYPKVAELGRIMFLTGLLAALLGSVSLHIP